MIHPVDKYVGSRLRGKRLSMGLSQEDMGMRTGITFQQVQKYEKGLNRIAISRLYEFAQILGVPIEWFLEGFEGNDNSNENLNLEMVDNKETLTLIRIYFSVSPVIRKKALNLLQSISKLKSDNSEDVEE